MNGIVENGDRADTDFSVSKPCNRLWGNIEQQWKNLKDNFIFYTTFSGPNT